MRGIGTKWMHGLVVVAVVAAMALGTLLAGVVVNGGLVSSARPSGGAEALAPQAASSIASASASVSSTPAASGPHPGQLEIYEVAPGGATTEDPAVAYDTVSYEPIINVFETLLTYNGTASTSFVPVLATCVPGTPQCTTDYGSSLVVDNTKNQPTYYTFVIDPAAKFYDPATGASWGVYPTDVMFSMAREMAYSEAIGVGNTPGWLVAQALLPNGSATWDGGIHAPYNTTPSHILGSMFINDSTYCPAAAMTNAHGCITFNVSGQGGPWSFFLQLIGDGFMGILPCGWYTYQGAGVPGWGATAANASKGDGSCALPNGGTTTSGSAWTTYLAGLNPEGWDTFESSLASTYPAPAPNVQWNMVGSGPYYAVVTPTSSPPGYSLVANPAYAQPVGCSGAGGIATYGGYCWPAAKGYIADVAVYYEGSDATGLTQFKAGVADLAGIQTVDTGEMLALQSEGKLHYISAPALSVFFQMPNLNWSQTAYTTAGLPGSPSVPGDFFSGAAVRGLMSMSVPYDSALALANTVDGVVWEANTGGPIVPGMQNYSTNVSYPYLKGDSVGSPTTVGSAAWWWHVGTTIGSGYYDPELAQCLNKTCVFPMIGENGAPQLDIQISLEISSIEAVTGDHLQPYTYDLNFGGSNSLISYQLGGEGPGAAPLPYWNLGWAADNFAPEDYLIPLAFPNSTYTYGDAVWQQFNLKQYDDVATCGHSAATFADLVYWAKQPAINSSCEGVAYDIVNAFFYNSTHQTNSTVQGLLYWGIQAVLNSLNLYTWDGLAQQITAIAPWIAPSSINTNPTIGGGNDQYWFQLHYQSLYNVTVSQTGLASGTTWQASAGPQTVSTTKGSITFAGMPNGTYNYSASYVPGYSLSPSNGTVTISGGSPSQAVVYTSFTTTTVPVTFNETGLVSNTSWTVIVGGYGAVTTSAPSMVFNLPVDGSYGYAAQHIVGYFPGPSGSFVTATSPVNITVSYAGFFAKTYQLTFVETGLPAGTSWSVGIGPSGSVYTLASETKSITFYQTNGSTSYSVGTVAGFAAAVTAGAASIQGSTVVVPVVFNPTYSVTFTPSGLPTGASYTVYFGGVSKTGTSPAAVSFTVTNGSWTFSVTSSGHTASPAGGSVTVSGKAQSVGIAFTSSSTSTAWTYLSPLAYYLIGVLAALAVIGFVLAVAFHGRGKAPPAKPPESWEPELPATQTTGPAGGETPSPPSGGAPPST